MTAGRFNPNNPAVLGNEWYVTDEFDYTLDTTSSVLACHFAALSTEDISTVDYYLHGVAGAQGLWETEMLFGGLAGAITPTPDGLYTFDNGTDLMYLPCYNTNTAGTAGITFGGLSYPLTGSGAFILEAGNDKVTTGVTNSAGSSAGPFSPELTGMFQNDITSAGILFPTSNAEFSAYGVTANTLRHLSGRRIISVQVVGYLAFFGGSSLTPYLKIGGAKYNGKSWVDVNGSQSTQQATWYTNPANNKAWSIADLETFQGNDSTFGWRAHGCGGPNSNYIALYQGAIIVNFADENRLGLGYKGGAALLEAAWNAWNFSTPDYYNMLFADESSFEGGTGSWTALTANTTLTSSATVAFSGTKSLRIEATVAGTKTVGTEDTPITRKIPVTAGRTYYLSAELRAVNTVRSCTIGIRWYDGSNALLSTSSSAAANDATGAWTLFTASGVAPATAAWAQVIVTITSQGIAPEFHFVDGVMLTVNKQDSTFLLGGSARTTVPKTTGDDLVLTLRHMPGGSAGGPIVPILDSGSAVPMPPANAIEAYLPSLGSTAGNITDMNDAITPMFGVRLIASGVDSATDGFPYAILSPVPVNASSPVVTYFQYVPSPGVANYGYLKAVVSLGSVDAVSDLTIKVKDVFGTIQYGPTLTFAAADLETPRAHAQVIAIPIDPQVMLGAVTYTIEFSSTGATEALGWYVYAPDTTLPGLFNTNNSLTYAGTAGLLVDTAGVGQTLDNGKDIAVTLSQLPPTPEDFNVDLITGNLDGIDFAEITWLSDNALTADASSFELSTGGWTVTSNAGVSSSATAQAFVGTSQLLLTSAAAGAMSAGTAIGTAGYAVTAGKVVTIVGHIRTAVTARSCSLDIKFYDSSGTLLSTTAGSTTSDATARWQRITTTATAPTDAAYMSFVYNVAATGGAAEVHHLDGVIAWTGTALPSNFGYYPGDLATSKITAPDSATLSPVGDINLIAHVGMDSWVQTTGSLISKWNTTGNQRSFRLYIDAASKLNLDWSADGTAVITKTSTVALSVASGSETWVRATLDVDNGAAGNTVTFYQSPDGINWVVVGAAVVTAGTTSVFNSTSQIELGSHNAVGSQMTNVNFFDAQIYGSLTDASPLALWALGGLAIGTTTVTYGSEVLTLAGNTFVDEWQVGIGDTFAAYVIERSDDGGVTWNVIARITSINTQFFDDYEGKRNNTATYRMFIENIDDVFSTATDEDTALPTYTQCGYQLTSNEDPTLNLTYLDEPDRQYQFPDVAHEWQLYARDYAVVFRETENRGDVFTINFWLYMDGTPVSNNVPDISRGRVAFQPLIDLVRAPLSYVCVLDQDGNRWFAALLMDKSTATRKEPGGKYLFPIRVRQVTATPSEVESQP